MDAVCGLVHRLDDFTSVNDTLGHPVGDHGLVAVAERLRASALVARNSRILGVPDDEALSMHQLHAG